jgi:DNA-binding transcriptional LysR family regulator
MFLNSNRFLLTAEECELLLELEEAPSLSTVAEKMGRDHSVISRCLKRVSEKAPVVEKKAGRWMLTEVGKKFNNSSRTMIAAQASLSQTYQSIRIGTNREFAARVLGPDLGILMALLPKTSLSINAYENGTEEALLNGQIDIGFDCDRPHDPEIAYKLIADEPILPVCGKSFYKKHQKAIQTGNYIGLPHLMCERLYPDKILSKLENHPEVVARFNDIATVRAACLQNVGWALLPGYAVKEELLAKKLIQMDDGTYGKSKYGIWWVRHRPYLKDTVEKLTGWLQSKEL